MIRFRSHTAVILAATCTVFAPTWAARASDGATVAESKLTPQQAGVYNHKSPFFLADHDVTPVRINRMAGEIDPDTTTHHVLGWDWACGYFDPAPNC